MKHERRTLNVERPTSNWDSGMLQAAGFYFDVQRSMFNVRRSLFHSVTHLSGRLRLGFLLAAALTLATAMSAPAQDGPRKNLRAVETFYWARVHFSSDTSVPDQWNISPFGDAFFLDRLREQTGIQVDDAWHVAPLNNLNELTKYPLLFMTADGDFACTPQEFANLKEYLLRGGFLFADDCVYGREGDLFFQGFKSKIENAFGKKMVKLPDSHEIYHTLYDLQGGLPYMQGQPHGGWALFLEGRMVIFLSSSDIHCGWCSASGRNWFSRQKGEDALKMGINIVIYAMTH